MKRLRLQTEMADGEHSSIIANRIRSLKFTDNSIARASVPRFVPRAHLRKRSQMSLKKP